MKPQLTKCCSKCVGAYKDSDLDKGICRDINCKCHLSSIQESEPKQMWEEDLQVFVKKGDFEMARMLFKSVLLAHRHSLMEKIETWARARMRNYNESELKDLLSGLNKQ